MKLQATLRTVTGKQVNKYRKQGNIPAVIYSKHHKQAINIFVEKNHFLKAYKEAGTSTPIELTGKSINELVLIHEVSVHPVTTMLSHIDFLGVKKGEAVQAEVHLEYIGESPVEKDKLGRVQTLLDNVQVSAKPMDLPKSIQVDLSTLVTTQDVIFIKDLTVGKGVTILNDANQAIATIVGNDNSVEEEVISDTPIEEETTTE